MRWPWVSRKRYEHLVKMLKQKQLEVNGLVAKMMAGDEDE